MNLLYLSFSGGGLDTNVRVLGPALVRAGHHVSVLYIHLPREPIRSSNSLDGCDVHHATIGNWHYYLHRATFGKSSLARITRGIESAMSMARTISTIASQHPIDIIEIPETWVTPRLVGTVAYVIRLHSAEWTWRRMLLEPEGASGRVDQWVEGYSLRRAAGISSPSRAVADYIRSTCNLDSRPIEIIPYPIDTSHFVPGQARSNPPIVLFVGRVERRKGADTLISAMQLVWGKYPDCQLVLAGQVSDELKDYVKGVDTSVRFLGALPHKELVRWYQRASIFAAPSLWDNSPNTIYEAMACGTPVVATRVGGIPELVDHAINGLLVPPLDEHALADAIIVLLDDPAQRRQMGQRAREKALANYSVEKILARTLAFYERALT